MDISNIKATETIERIKHPKTGEDIGIGVSIMALSDERLKRLKRQITDKRLQLERKGKGFTAEQIEENNKALLFAAMTGWTWGKPVDENGKEIADASPATFHGETPAFNQKNVYAVFEELEWFKDQIDEKLGDTKSFFQ